MNIARNLFLTCTAILTLSVPALAGVTVNSPSSGSQVGSSFKLSASSSSCSNGNVVTMGYSFDSSSDTTVVNGQSIEKTLSASNGSHTLHVKAWAPGGRSCVSDVKITVSNSVASADVVSSPTSIIPSSADEVSSIEALSGWQATHDTAGDGSSSGSMSMVASPSKYGSSRRFVTSFKNNGTERYSVVFSDNVNAKNIFYDTWIYLTSSSKYLGNIEMDINQVMPSGKTALIGIQCDGWTGNWAYNVNTGSPSSPKPKWASKSGTSCNPRNWSQGTWHHVQASFSRDDSGHVTYKSIWLDGVETKMNVTAFVGASLGWDPVINTQFQIDGYGSSGTVTTYVDGLTISTW